jgi:hypothetical protein
VLLALQVMMVEMASTASMSTMVEHNILYQVIVSTSSSLKVVAQSSALGMENPKTDLDFFSSSSAHVQPFLNLILGVS